MSFDQISSACHFLLNNFPDAEDAKKYIDARVTKEYQSLFQFGYFPPPFKMSVLFDLVDESVLKSKKLYYSKYVQDASGPSKFNFSYFEDYPLVLPFKDTYGEVIALVGRTLLSEEDRKEQGISKYKNTVFKKGNYLFGLFENKANILLKDEIIVVEGQIDVIKAMEHGINNIVALGNSSMTAYQFSLIMRYTKNIKVILDNDEAGQKGRVLIRNKFGKKANIEDIYIDDKYKDLDEYLKCNPDVKSFEDINVE